MNLHLVWSEIRQKKQEIKFVRFNIKKFLKIKNC